MIEVLVPRENVNDEVVIIQKLIIESGSEIKAGQLIMEIETSKTTIEVLAPEAGTIHFNVLEGEEVPVGEVLCQIFNDNADDLKQQNHDVTVDDNDTELVRYISKSASDAATKYGVDIAALPSQWISLRNVMTAAGVPVPAAPAIPNQNALPITGDIDAEKLDGLPTHVAQPLDLRKRAEIANLSVLGSGLRQSSIGISSPPLNKRLSQPIPLFAEGIADLVVYEASRLLKEFPLLNGFYSGNNSFSLYEEVHAGVSFDNNCNLKVLRIENSDRLELGVIQRTINGFLAKFEADENLSAELKPATFTVTDLAHTSADFMYPLLNGYQSLIIGIVRKDSNNKYQLIASFDHRVTEGLYVTRFLDILIRNISSHFSDSASGVASRRCYFCQKSMQEERSLGNRGFINITIESGEQVEICRNCFDGW